VNFHFSRDCVLKTNKTSWRAVIGKKWYSHNNNIFLNKYCQIVYRLLNYLGFNIKLFFQSTRYFRIYCSWHDFKNYWKDIKVNILNKLIVVSTLILVGTAICTITLLLYLTTTMSIDFVKLNRVINSGPGYFKSNKFWNYFN